MPRLIVVIGPTGVGKTAHAIEIALKHACPIISADSRQIYRDLPIGTAAPTPFERQLVPHYLVAFKELHENYNAGQFARDAAELLKELFTQHETVVLVGGSMMYVEALCNGLDDIPEVPQQIRDEVRAMYQQSGLTWLQQEVQRLDPVYWQEVDQNNPQRLMHCIEVSQVAGKPYSDFRTQHRATPKCRDFDVEYVLVERPREELYARINQRVDQMIADGLLEEARDAFSKLGVPLDGTVQLDYANLPNSINTVGYKELLRYFRGEWTLDKAIEMIKQNSRHYAKRQMTWWRSRQIGK
jgi:tRNA dimethylallyltransferase